MVKKQPTRKIDKKTVQEYKSMSKLTPAQRKKLEQDQQVKDVKKEDLKMFQGFWGRWNKKKTIKQPQNAYLITMFYNNGTEKTFTIVTEKNTFLHRAKLYVIIYEEVWKDLNMDNYHFYYNEGCPVPINRELSWIRDSDAEIGKEEAFFSVSPHNLKSIIKMEYVQALANAVELNKYLQLNTIMNFFNIVLGLASVIMLYFGFWG